MEKEGKVTPNWSTEVDHINWVKAWNGQWNIRVISRTANRIDGARKANRNRKNKMKY